MLIDWFTVGAQVLNFLILVWLLKRFLYKPVLDAIDAREISIAAELTAAAAKQAEAQRECDEFKSKNLEFDEQRSALLATATEQNDADRRRLLGEARKEAEDSRIKYADALRAGAARLESKITQLAKDEIFGIARKALADLATASLEERMSDVFIRRLRALNAKEKDLLAVALRSSSEPALLRSSFDLPPQERAKIQNALNEAFSTEVRLRFDSAPDALCGIELTAGGQKLAWSIGDYLKALEQKVGQVLDTAAMPAAAAPAAATPAPVPVVRTVAK
jgi:F-type H+-transporting ATPase subunit b